MFNYHSMPSISAPGKSASGRRLVRSAAFPLWRCSETRWNRWLVVSRSSVPLCLARAAPSFFNCPMATSCMPPSVSNKFPIFSPDAELESFFIGFDPDQLLDFVKTSFWILSRSAHLEAVALVICVNVQDDRAA